MVEKVAESDDALIEKYLSGEELTIDEIKEGVKKMTISTQIYPVFCGSALSIKVFKSIRWCYRLLTFSKRCSAIKAIKVDTGEEINVESDENGPFTALAFKIQTDPYVGRLTYFRVYSGKATAGSYIQCYIR